MRVRFTPHRAKEGSMKINLSSIIMRYHDEGDETWVTLVIVDMDGAETTICRTAVDASTIRVDLISNAHSQKN